MARTGLLCFLQLSQALNFLPAFGSEENTNVRVEVAVEAYFARKP